MSNVKKIFYDLQTVADVLSMSESTIKALIRKGEFPAPRKLSPQRVGWLVHEIDSWAEARPPSDLLPPPNCGAKKPRKTMHEDS